MGWRCLCVGVYVFPAAFSCLHGLSLLFDYWLLLLEWFVISNFLLTLVFCINFLKLVLALYVIGERWKWNDVFTVLPFPIKNVILCVLPFSLRLIYYSNLFANYIDSSTIQITFKIKSYIGISRHFWLIWLGYRPHF